MASRESSFQLQTLTGTVYTYANAYIVSGTDGATSATVRLTAGARMNSNGGALVVSDTGIGVSIWINGTQVVDKRSLFGNGSNYYGSSSYTETYSTLSIPKGTSSADIVCYCEFYEGVLGNYVGSRRGYRQTLTPDSVRVSAKTHYTVSYDANGGSNAPSSQTKWYNESLTLTSSSPSRTGYSFLGWATSSSATTATYCTGTNHTTNNTYNTNSAQTLYAVWQKNTWVVKVYGNGADTGSTQTLTKTYQTPLTLPTSGFTKQYYSLIKWNTSPDGGGTSYALNSSYTADADLTLYAIWQVDVPQAPMSLEAAYTPSASADTAGTIEAEWTRPPNADATWQDVILSISIDGGSTYQSSFSLAGSSTSYTLANALLDKAYKLMVQAHNNGGGGQYSVPAYTDTVYTRPKAPDAITVREKESGSTDVVLELSNTSAVATGFDVEYSADGGSTWSTTGMTVESYVGTPVTQVTLGMTDGGTHIFRVRNVGTHGSETLNSAWTVSGEVTTIAPPNPPTLVSPASGGVVPFGGQATRVTFQWQHNPVDGTSQTAAEIVFTVNGASTTVTATTAQSKVVQASFGASGTQVTWKVRTKGADEDWSGWSQNSTFTIYASPSITVQTPTSPIIGVPVNYRLSYTDTSGIFASGTLSIIHNNSTVYSEPLPSPSGGYIEGAVFAAEFLPQDGETYTFKFDVLSNTTLSATRSVNLDVDMQAPHIGTLDITNDPDTGYVSLVYGWDNNDGGQAADLVTVYRVTKDGRMELASSTSASGNSCLDMYAPLNTEYSYLVVTHGTNQAINQREFPTMLNTGWWFVYWNGKIARAKWNPNGSMTVSRPQRTRVHYIGRKDPVSYDGTAVSEETSMEWQIVEREYAMAFLEMIRDIGRGIYKSGSGEVYHADFDQATVSSDFHRNQPYGSLNLPIVRIDGEPL